MKVVSGRDFAKIVERHGWKLLRIHGSHHIYANQDKQCGFRSQSTATGH